MPGSMTGPEPSLPEIVRADGRYAPGAFEFLYAGLERATQLRYGERPKPGQGHVSGQELCLALRELAIERWGALAGAVLRRWGVKKTRDFGEMVFLLVEHELMGRQEEDRVEDFDDVYAFSEAFDGYQIPLDNIAAQDSESNDG